MIETRGLTKLYRDLTAIEDVTFAVGKGEIVGFLGPNGAGKTTTMKILTGFMPPSRGLARVAGFDVYEAPMEVKRRIGYMPEHPPVYPDLTVHEYLRFVGRLKELKGPKLKDSIARVVETVDLAPVIDRLIRNISKGYQQRTGLAQALLGSPEVLILDEPTVGMDPGQIVKVRNIIKSLAGDHTVILSTHILQEVTATCERVIIINNGRIVADDNLEVLVSANTKPGVTASLEQVFLSLTGGGSG
jgi:ABC-2 type transport system ATP-binding protein